MTFWRWYWCIGLFIGLIVSWRTHWYPAEMWNIEQKHNKKNPYRPEYVKGSARMYNVFWCIWIAGSILFWPIVVVMTILDKMSGKKVSMKEIFSHTDKKFEDMGRDKDDND